VGVEMEKRETVISVKIHSIRVCHSCILLQSLLRCLRWQFTVYTLWK